MRPACCFQYAAIAKERVVTRKCIKFQNTAKPLEMKPWVFASPTFRVWEAYRRRCIATTAALIPDIGPQAPEVRPSFAGAQCLRNWGDQCRAIVDLATQGRRRQDYVFTGTELALPVQAGRRAAGWRRNQAIRNVSVTRLVVILGPIDQPAMWRIS